MNIYKEKILVGIDEAGRGCLCGPVCAASLYFPREFSLAHELADSKALLPAQREHLAQHLRQEAIWGIGWAYPHEIDELNIHHASLLAMTRALHQMRAMMIAAINTGNMPIPKEPIPKEPVPQATISKDPTPKELVPKELVPKELAPCQLTILVDGKFCPPDLQIQSSPTMAQVSYSVEAIVKGDSKVDEIKAASIVAKTSRDDHMCLLDAAFPMYKLKQHKGYPTAEHRQRLLYYGSNHLYRKSFLTKIMR